MNQSAQTLDMVTSHTTNIYLIIIFLLTILIIAIYFYFNTKLTKQNIYFTDEAEKKKEKESSKNVLLSNMSDEMYTLTQKLVTPNDLSPNMIEEKILDSANNLRELLKIQANKIEIYNEKFALNDMLDDVSMYLSSNFHTRNTELIFDIDNNVPNYLRGDVVHFSRIINNILEFSIHATPEGTVTLKISTANSSANALMLHISIVDTSIGLLDDAVNILFDLEYDKKTQKHKRLRLYIAKKLILGMGGSIGVNTVIGKGNTFTLKIPMQLNEEVSSLDYQALKIGIKEKRVLIYSEKLATGELLKKLFSCFYVDVSVASREAYNKHTIHRLDCELLVVDDTFFHTTINAQLNSIKQNTSIEVIVFQSIFLREKSEKNELVNYLSVPFNIEKVIEILKPLNKEVREDILVANIEENDDIHVEKKIQNTDIRVFNEPVEETQNIDIDCFTYFKGAKLLVVEDNLINQKIIISVLNKSGVMIEIANNGQEALDILFIEKKRFDMVLMDISMPVMDGLIATKRIREKSEFDNLPIVTFTAFAMGTEIEEMFQAGCNAYLTKPLNIKKLYTIFDMFISTGEREVSLKKSIQIDGLDIEKGIEWADESEVLYKETLKEFVLVYQDMIVLVPKWLKEKHYDRVKVACTDIQGMLGAIGAYDMKEVVDEMQKIFLYNNEEFLDKYILVYPEKLETLIGTIKRYIKS